jgi:hypothetical protein
MTRGSAPVIAAAIEQTRHPVRYDGAYRRIAYRTRPVTCPAIS